MAAFNVVRFRVKPGCEQQFIELHRSIRPEFKGHVGSDLIRTGERTFCLIGKWKSMDALAAARPEMIAVLDQLRDLLEDLGGELGVTDPVSGEAVLSIKAAKKSKAKAGKRKKKSAKDKAKAKQKGRSKGKVKKKKGSSSKKRKGKR